MPLKTIVKVSHISNLSDARYCAGMGVEMLGFRVIPGSEKHMPSQLFQEIRGWISGPGIIAELYGISDASQIEVARQTYAPDYFELTFEAYQRFSDYLTLPCIVYLPKVSELASLRGDEKKVSYVLVDAETLCEEISTTDLPVLIKINSPIKLNEKIDEGCFKGFVLEGPEELRPGITNYEQLGSILEALEED